MYVILCVSINGIILISESGIVKLIGFSDSLIVV